MACAIVDAENDWQAAAAIADAKTVSSDSERDETH